MPRKKENVTDKLVNKIVTGEYDLFLDQFNRPSIINQEEPLVADYLNSKSTYNLLSKFYWEEEGKALRKDVLGTAISTLEGIATFSNDSRQVFNRVARHEDTIYYDLGDNKNVVAITEEDWGITQECPISFRRYSHQQVQVTPSKDEADLKKLLPYLNLKEQHHEILILSYLPVALIPDIPRPLLVLHGPQGAGKTTCLEMLRSLIDPSTIPTLSPARYKDEMIQQADHNYAYFLDNISSIRRDISDMLCRFVTGAAFSKRELYTNDEEYLYQFNRVVGMNGVALATSQPDLLDRSLLIQLDRISASDRKRQIELRQRFEQDRPVILGGLFTVLSQALQIAQNLELNDLPRMADYYLYASASSQALGYGVDQFSLAFEANAKEQHEEAIEVSPVAKSILKLMDKKVEWIGNSTHLFNELHDIAEELGVDRYFPKSASWLWRKIVEVKTNLEAYRIEATLSRDSQYGRTITLINREQEELEAKKIADSADKSTDSTNSDKKTALELLNAHKNSQKYVDRRQHKYARNSVQAGNPFDRQEKEETE